LSPKRGARAYPFRAGFIRCVQEFATSGLADDSAARIARIGAAALGAG